jgi:hypothetical protein
MTQTLYAHMNKGNKKKKEILPFDTTCINLEDKWSEIN